MPGRASRIVQDVPRHRGLAGADGNAGGIAPPLGIGPGDAGCLQVAFVVPRPGRRAHRLGFVLFGQAHPGQAIAAHVHNGFAHALQQIGFFGGAHERLIDLVDHLQGAVQSADLFLRPLALDRHGDLG